MATTRVEGAAERGRITARVPQHVADVIEEAAMLQGSPVNQFVVQAALEKAEKIIENEKVIHMSPKGMAWLFGLLDNPPAPTPHLVDAMKRHQARKA